MSLSQKLIGWITGNGAEVDAGNNLQVSTRQVNQRLGGETPQPNFVGAVRLFSELDPGGITGEPYLKSPLVSEFRRLAVGVDTVSAVYNFTPTTQNTGDFKHAFTTMTMTQSAGFLNINPALATVSGNYAYLQSWKHCSLSAGGQNRVEFVLQAGARLPPANQVLEFGQFVGTAGVAPADGIFWRLTSAGLYGVLSYNGTETPVLIDVNGLPSVSDNANFEMTISQAEIHFWIDGVFYAEIVLPAGQGVPFLSLNLPICIMMRNSGTVVGGLVPKCGRMAVHQLDLNTVKPWAEQMGIQGNAYQGQEGDSQGSLAIYTNSALAAAAALVNTSAAAQFTGLGGVALVLPTLAAGTDGILFSYQNPVGSVTQPPKTLVVTGIMLDAGVAVALTGGPLTLVMGAAYGHTAVSLATAETGSFVTATTKAPRRVPLGVISFPVTAPAGTGVPKIVVLFQSPLVVHPGEFFAITCRNQSTVTSAGSLAMTACIDHYFE